MQIEWFKDCTTEEAKAERKELIKTARPTLKVLKNILQKRIEAEELYGVKKERYDSPVWSHVQADINGTVRTLRSILSLLDLDGE